MRFKPTNYYEEIPLLPEQAKNVSSSEKINQALKQAENHGLTLCVNEERIGFLLLRQFSPRCFFLWNLIIDPVHQNQGYGTRALFSLISYLKEKCDGEKLTTTYISDNEQSRALYEKIGFSEVDRVDVNGVTEVNLTLQL